VKVTFLGTGTSHGVPMIGCTCATCLSDDPRDKRWRPSIAVELADHTSILVDTGPDLRAQALRFGLTRVDVILYTHSHADHVVGLDEVRRFNAVQRSPIPCYGDAGTLTDVRRMFAYVFEPATPVGGGIPRLELAEIAGEFCIGPATILPVPIRHGGRPVLGFRIGRFAYLTDCNAIPDASWALLDGLDVIVLGALRQRPHPTHFSVDEALVAAERVGAGHTYFTHMCHDLPHAETCARLPPAVELAYDGLVLEIADE
jgi:phosphoribosyl 1,2-cyclic phosphate phosphodiesterase